MRTAEGREACCTGSATARASTALKLALPGSSRDPPHQIFTRFSGARYILSPSFTSKAV